MKIKVYRSSVNSGKYLSIPHETEIEELPIPENFDPDLLKLSPFRSELDIEPGEERIGMDTDGVIKQIQKNGYAIHGATMVITIKP